MSGTLPQNESSCNILNLEDAIKLCALNSIDQKSIFLSMADDQDVGYSTEYYYLLNDKRICRPLTNLCTGSRYVGEWNCLGIASQGVYIMPHGVIYDGCFNNEGEFHGYGVLKYPNGLNVPGIWKNGKLENTTETREHKRYCTMPDRRFSIEETDCLGSVDHEYLTNAPNPPREIPPGCYDAGFGMYDPKYRLLTVSNGKETVKQSIADLNVGQCLREMLKDTLDELEIPITKAALNEIYPFVDLEFAAEVKHRWVVNKCRKSDVGNVGYRPDLYETWTTGERSQELEMAKMSLVRSFSGDRQSDNSINWKDLCCALKEIVLSQKLVVERRVKQ